MRGGGGGLHSADRSQLWGRGDPWWSLRLQPSTPTRRWKSEPSTYFVQDPVSIFNGSFNNLLDPLRVVFIRMNSETLEVSA